MGVKEVIRPWFVGLALVAALPLACESTEMPGRAYGTYSVTGKLSTNSCGSSVDAPDPWTFTVDLSKDGSTLYWNWNDGRALLSGVVDDEALSTTIESTVAGAADSDGGTSNCSMQRHDAFALKLATGEPPGTFDGGITYTFSTLSGDCSSELSSAGGEYQTLPCTISYTIDGTRQ